MDEHYFYLIPLTAALANISLLAYFFAGSGDFERIMRGLLIALALTNLGLLLILTAPHREAARLRLHLLRHALFCVPLLLLLLSNYVSGRRVFTAAARGVAAFTLLFLILIQFTYFSHSTILIRELKQHAWGYFPVLNTGGMAVLGGLFIFSFLNSMYVLLRGAISPVGRAHRSFAFLIFIWWLGFFMNVPALLGWEVYPVGNAMDAVLCIGAAAVLHKLRPAPGPRFLLLMSELLASLGFGSIAGGILFLLWGNRLGAGTAPIVSLISTAAALVFLQFIKTRSAAAVATISETAEYASLFAELNLSQQERRICELIHAGYSRKQIAFFLSITDGTLRNHLAAIYARTLPKTRGTGSRDQFQRLTLLLNRSAAEANSKP